MAVTMKDIAQAAGVSVGTVDRALHNRGRISPDVKQQILTIAKQMNYQKNFASQSLAARKQSYKVAVVLHILKNDFFTEILSGVQTAKKDLSAFGVDIDIYPCNNFAPQHQLQLIDKAIGNGADAIALVPIDDSCIKQKMKELHDQDFPVVFLASFLEDTPCLSSIRCDYVQAGKIAAGLIRLISRQDGKFLFFTPPLSMVGHRYRLRGLQEIVMKHHPKLEIAAVIELTNDSFENYQAATAALSQYPDVNCVVYGGSTYHGLKAIQECSRPIHSVFYDMPPQIRESLKDYSIDAVITQNPQEQGRLAIMILFDYLAYQRIPEPVIIVENQILITECLD